MKYGATFLADAIVNYIKTHKVPLGLCALFFAISCFLLFLSKTVQGFGAWYASTIYPVLPNTLGRLFSPLPFSLFECLVCLGLLILCAFILLLVFAPWSVSGRRFLRVVLKRGLSMVLCLAGCLFFLQTLTCLINYSRPDFAGEIGIETYAASQDDLKELCLLLISDLRELTEGAEQGTNGLRFDENNSMTLEHTDWESDAKAAMKGLGERYPSLSGYYPDPKPIFFSRAMSSLSLTGIFSPYTTEPNYNRDVTPYVIPYTICHELAHAKGYIKENEAGFIAYLACAGSDSPQFRYSGALNALSYSLNALYRSVPQEEYQSILSQVPEQALVDLRRNQAYWQQFRQGLRGVISQTAQAANDSYLRANAQSDGSKSYGRMVDLLLAYYKIGAQEL